MEHNLKLERPKVGVVVLIFKDGRILLGRRVGDGLAPGTFGAPGGHMEHQETLVECAKREVLEETGGDVINPRFICVTNVRQFAPAHYVMVVLKADWKNGDPVTCEPDRCEGWSWFGLDELPTPLTPATQAGVLALHNQQLLFEDTIS